jgi:Flp pilus assembly protein TadG
VSDGVVAHPTSGFWKKELPVVSLNMRLSRGGLVHRRIMAEDGSATVEAVLWIPFFMLLLALIADASFLFHRQAQMLRAVQDVNRAFSTGQIESTEAVQEILVAQYTPLSEDVQAVSVLDTETIPSGIIRTSLSIPAADVNSIGLIAGLGGFNLTVTSQHYREF